MIKTKKNCRVCQAILGQPKKWEGRLARRIYESRYYMPSSSYSLKDVSNEYHDKFTYESLLNHCKKHQFLSEDDFNKRHLRIIANQAEKTIVKESIKATQVWDSVIGGAMEKLQNGEMQLTANHLLKAAKDKSDHEFKAADQQLAMMEMVFHFASGEDETVKGIRRDDVIEGTIVSEEPTGDFESREDRSRTFYESLARDAPTPGTD